MSDSAMFLASKYRKYYNTAELLPPSRFARREYGFIFHGKGGMWRHIGFRSIKEYRDFLREKAPAHAYYSTAYYQNPVAARMVDKGWMGAELIFDLDADHLENAETMSFEEQLAQVKREFATLVHEFILGDFGFDPKHVQLTFSGGRGYHCHVTDPHVLSLGSPERREIVDYVLGTGFDSDLIFSQSYSSFVDKRGISHDGKGQLSKMSLPSEPGWRGRAAKSIISFFEEVHRLEHDDAVSYLKNYSGIGAKGAEKIKRDLTDARLRQIRNGNVGISSTLRSAINTIVEKSAVHLEGKGETDEPVTADIKRLIRLPGSIHGKTGLKVVEVGIDELDDFDPLVEAVAFGDMPLRIEMLSDFEITIGGEHHRLKKGSECVPEYLAVFLVGRKLAVPL